jgi:hypothetical protein
MLIAPTQSATPMPRQVNRRIYFHTIIAASKALRFTVEMRARSWVGSGQVALRIPLHSGYAAARERLSVTDAYGQCLGR